MMPDNDKPSVWGAGHDAALKDKANAVVKFMLSDLAKSGLEPSDGNFVVTPEGYRLPYYAPDGTMLPMHRLRLMEPGADGRKYTQPSRQAIGSYALHPFFPLGWASGAQPGDALDIHEGEKKALCALKHGHQTAIGIGGHSNWMDPGAKGAVHGTIISALRDLGLTTVRLWPDGDISKHQVAMGWGALARALKALDFEVKIMDLRPFGHGAKFDDLVVEQGYDAVVAGAAIADIGDLSISQAELLRAIPSLISEQVGSGEFAHLLVRPTEYNLAELFRKHEAFKGQFWYNEDTLDYMHEDKRWVDGLTITSALMVLQSQFGFSKRGNTAASKNVEAAMMTVARENARSPFADYLHSLTWDGQQRLGSWLHDYLFVEPSPFHSEVGTKFVVGAVDRTLNPGCIHRWMLILQGPQAIGKSGVPRALAGAENVSSLTLAADSKDMLLAIHRGVINNMDELAAYSRAADFEHLKALISEPSDTFRVPYGRTTEIQPRRSVMMGSVNHADFLRHDASGNNRYVVVPCEKKFDFVGLAGARDQLWAEAVVLQRSGYLHDEIAGANEVAAQYEQDDPFFTDVRRLLPEILQDVPTQPGAKAFRLPRLMVALGYNVEQMHIAKQLGRTLRTLDFKAILCPKSFDGGGGRIWIKHGCA